VSDQTKTDLALLGQRVDHMDNTVKLLADSQIEMIKTQAEIKEVLVRLIEQSKEQERHTRQITELYRTTHNHEVRITTSEKSLEEIDDEDLISTTNSHKLYFKGLFWFSGIVGGFVIYDILNRISATIS